MSVPHFLTLLDLPSSDVLEIVSRAIELKTNPAAVNNQSRKTLGLIFEKSSTRTRVAFEVAMTQMNGASLFLTSGNSQLGRGEPIEDAARVLSRMVDCVAIRTFAHNDIERFAACSRVPVINALSNDYHPCQPVSYTQLTLPTNREV